MSDRKLNVSGIIYSHYHDYRSSIKSPRYIYMAYKKDIIYIPLKMLNAVVYSYMHTPT